MYLEHRPIRSEWDDAYTNFRVTAGEARFAIGVLGAVAALLLVF